MLICMFTQKNDTNASPLIRDLHSLDGELDALGPSLDCLLGSKLGLSLVCSLGLSVGICVGWSVGILVGVVVILGTDEGGAEEYQCNTRRYLVCEI